MTRFYMPATLGLCMALAFGAPAFAAGFPVYGGQERATATIKVTDADLHSPAGARTLALRIRVATAAVCDGDDPIIRASDGFRQCQEASIGRAIDTLGSPAVAKALGRPSQALARSGR